MALRNAARLQRKLLALPRRYQRPVENALLAAAQDMSSFAIVKIQRNSGTGRRYKRGGRIHIASSPGEYPNADFGELVRKMFAEKRGRLTAVWGNTAKHALFLEIGTSRMAARPFMRPTLLALRDKIQARVRDAVRSALKAAARG